MKTFSTLLSAAVITLSLASCSKESYTFQQSAAYRTSPATRVAAAPAAAATAETPAAELTASVAAPAVTAPATHKAARTYAAHVRATAPVAATKAAVSEVKATKATVKEMRKAVKAAKAAPAAEGKSQTVAAVLCFFLGWLGVHRFYLGYVGMGILELLTLGGFGILTLIDFIRIITGDLKPKDGDYTEKFND
ncbi:TM2 domain-containing protein [Hymenobacter algoricola]|uniref:TM2 domain-containing protein n=1 Tax=Hymenobacter algoricola TaxID=486267 RepID=A0ABP7NLK0_9BACT